MTDIAELVKRVDEYEAICLLKGVTSAAGLMREVHDALEAQAAEIARLQGHIEHLQEAVKCGCACDKPKDICLYHHKLIETARAEEREACANHLQSLADAKWEECEAVRHETGNDTPTKVEKEAAVTAEVFQWAVNAIRQRGE